MPFTDDDFGALFDAAPDAVAVVDRRYRIRFANLEAKRLFGYDRAELLELPAECLLPQLSRADLAGHFSPTGTSPRGTIRETVGVRNAGSEFPLDLRAWPVCTKRGTFVVLNVRDITERRERERKLVAARDSAEREREAKNALLAAASHDLRQPLQTAMLLGSVLKRLVQAGSKAATTVANQCDALRLTSELLESLLDLSRLEAGVMKPALSDVPIGTMFQCFDAQFRDMAESKGLELVVEDSDAVVHTDPALAKRIVQNLVGNAIRYTQRGRVELSCRVGRESVAIEVADTGVGIAEDALGTIFDEFYQVPVAGEMAREGTGLGLAIARRAAGLLGCSLAVESTPGRGSCFTLTVPRAQTRSNAAAADEVPADGGFDRNSRVLVVDDDPAVAEAMVMLLETAGCRCSAATGSAAAIAALSRCGDATVGLLVCDFHLGNGEDAFDVIREVRARTDERLPVILVSGDTSSATARAADRIGACHRVSKPVDAEALIDLCHRLLERYWAERGCSDSPTFDDASRELTRFHGLLPTNGSGDLAELGGKVIDRIVERHYAD